MADWRMDRVSELADRLEKSILSGELSPGDLLPSERELSARWQISRSVVREALGRLASLGLVRSVHGSGTRVERPSTKALTVGYRRLLGRADGLKLEDLVGVRLPLETVIALEAARNRTDGHLTRLDETQTVLGDPDADLDAHARADLEFHAALADASGNPLFSVVLAPIQELLIESRRRTLGLYGASLAFQHHQRILQAIRVHDALEAEQAMREHIETNFVHLRAVSQTPAQVEDASQVPQLRG